MADQATLLALDPICGTDLAAGQIAATYTYIGQTYSFCCKECRDLFAHAPEVYVADLAHEVRQCVGLRCPLLRSAGRP